jgi:hypothetical protein
MIGKSFYPITDEAFAICGYCGCMGPKGCNENDAHDLAVKAKWDAREIKLGCDVITIYTCPKCAEAEE